MPFAKDASGSGMAPNLLERSAARYAMPQRLMLRTLRNQDKPAFFVLCRRHQQTGPYHDLPAFH
jgi:hypothetical protein